MLKCEDSYLPIILVDEPQSLLYLANPMPQPAIQRRFERSLSNPAVLWGVMLAELVVEI
jgi:hypothetical protein